MKNPNVDLSTILSWQAADRPVSWTRRDAILYALGVGEDRQEFLYEKDKQFRALPTLWCAMSFRGTTNDVVDFNATAGAYPGLRFDPAHILHGEEYVELYEPTPTHGNFIQRTKTIDFLDKGKGGVLMTESLFVDAQQPNVVFARIIRSTFIRGLGGHEGRKKLEKDPRKEAPAKPNRAPDAIFTQRTTPLQAMLYRLSGDYNPLHADPDVAKRVGFEKPILHGLCTFGHATRAVLKLFPEISVKSVRCRFASPVLPGEELETRAWREGPEFILFETATTGPSGKVVLSEGVIQVANCAKF